jgi:hypothetical protein
MNGISPSIGKASLSEISDATAVGVQPAGFTFAIWGIIYSLLFVFAIYQTLPASMASTRNNDFIYNEIGWLWSINMVLNGCWLPIFQMNSTAGFICANVIILVMLATALLMAKYAVNAKLNWPEWIGFRLGMSIYAGWLSAATILNFSISLKVSGAADGWNEAGWSVAILWVAVVIYCGNALIH